VTNEELRDETMAALQPLPVNVRRLFGGYGLYLEGAFFGVIAEGRLYFRTDERSRTDYTARGMPALQPKFRPRGPKTVDRNFEVPSDVRNSPDELRAWALRAAATQKRRD
jgi:DNA transformation protein